MKYGSMDTLGNGDPEASASEASGANEPSWARPARRAAVSTPFGAGAVGGVVAATPAQPTSSTASAGPMAPRNEDPDWPPLRPGPCARIEASLAERPEPSGGGLR